MSAPLVVLVVEDELPMRRFLRAALEAQGYTLVETETVREGLAQAAGRRPDIVLLDLGLPDGDGLDLIRRLREWATTPIVVISARGRERDKVDALDAGADDYLTKPFGVDELLARMRVALRHAAREAAGADEPQFERHGVTLDFARRQVFVRGAEVRLTPTEYRLFAALARHAGKVLTHRQLEREVWGPNASEQTHNLRVCMAQLRRKLEADPARPALLRTEPGVGYRLRDD